MKNMLRSVFTLSLLAASLGLSACQSSKPAAPMQDHSQMKGDMGGMDHSKMKM